MAFKSESHRKWYFANKGLNNFIRQRSYDYNASFEEAKRRQNDKSYRAAAKKDYDKQPQNHKYYQSYNLNKYSKSKFKQRDKSNREDMPF